MRLITWNIQWGLGADGIMDPARIVAHARAMADFDVLCLQEVADNFPELKGGPAHDQFAIFADLLPGFEAIAFPSLEVRDEQGRPKRFGNLLLTRYRVVQVLRHLLPWGAAPTLNMPRGLIEVMVEGPWGPLRLMTTHLEFSHPALRVEQVEAIRAAHDAACARDATPRADGPGTYRRTPASRSAVLTGDFNMKPDDATLARLAEPFASGAPAFVDAWRLRHGEAPHPDSACIVDQSYAPPHCCDYVFVTQDLAPRLTRVAYDVDTRVSDHQPILVAFDAS